MNQTIARFLPLVLRVGVVALVAAPATAKFLDYGGQVAFFDSLGLPAPGLLVPVIGVVEIAAALLIAVGAAGRVAAAVLAAVMVGAMVFAAPNPLNVGVFVLSLALVALGTGAYSLWEPEDEWVGRVRGA